MYKFLRIIYSLPIRLLYSINDYLLFVKIKKKCILKGSKYNFKKGCKILLYDGSCKEDIVIGDNFTQYGTIFSQSGGKVVIGSNTRLGKNSIIRSVDSIFIGDFTAISDNVIITDNNNHPIDPVFRRKMKLDTLGGCMRLWKHSAHAPIFIGENVWVGENSRIQKGVSIGENSIVAAGSIVTKNVPANSIVAGIPAKVIKYI